MTSKFEKFGKHSGALHHYCTWQLITNHTTYKIGLSWPISTFEHTSLLFVMALMVC